MEHNYFKRHKDFYPKIKDLPKSDLGISVVIPSYNEPNLSKALNAILNCQPANCSVEVKVVVNYPENSTEEIAKNARECVDIVKQFDRLANNDRFRFFAIEAFNLPKKHAGVGLARKIGMDEAAWRLLNSANEYKIIACFDADSSCTENYLVEIEKLWEAHPDTEACSIRYEHPLQGDDFSKHIFQGIAQYELHLRYYVWAGRYIGHPFSYQTVGSSMACSAQAYVKYGGMNKNKAGEDFYFLQKIIPHGKFRELNTTIIIPSPRPSHRVPFGTGRAMTKYVEADAKEYFTYNFDSFLSLKDFFKSATSELFLADTETVKRFQEKLEKPLKQFLDENDFLNAIAEINSNTSRSDTFKKRFFLWFDAFLLLKYLNFSNESYYSKKPVVEESTRLINAIKKGYRVGELDTVSLLELYRGIDYKG